METNTLTENGVSTTKGLGEEMYIKCCLGAYRGKYTTNMTTDI